MNSAQRIVEMYRGFEIVAAYQEGRYHGRAWAKETGLNDQSADGEDINIVVSVLKRKIDHELRSRTAELVETLPARHKEYLESLGMPDKGLRKASLIGPHRASYCYRCGEPVDNKIDLECAVCSWIVCHSCAACGCGYESHKNPSPS